MKKPLTFPLLLAVLTFTISDVYLQATPITQTDSETLYLFEAKSLPSDIIPLYISGDTVLAFGSKISTENLRGTRLSELSNGDGYYLLRIQDKGIFKQFLNHIKYWTFGDAIVFSCATQEAERLSKYGWGLTRLVPISNNVTPVKISPPTVAVADSNISRVISAITPQTSRQLIADLSAIPTRYSYSEGCRQAEQYVFDKFDGLGLDVSFFNFQYSGTDMRDVIGQITGSTHPDSIIIVCAHLDCTSDTPTLRAPGAEDNGTGTAVVLEAARALSDMQTDLTVRFVTFSGEEQGLIGSEQYAASCQRQGDIIAAVINVDMVGYSGQYVQDMHVFSDPNSYSLGRLGTQILADYTTLDTVPHYGTGPQYGSDHYPFAIRGYPAIFFIDAWQGYDWYPYYHTVADTIGNLNMNQQAAIGQAVTAMAATLVRPHYAPSYLPGDANGSGSVTGLDVVFLVSYLKGGQAPDPVLRGDANGDCATTGLDVVYLVSYLKGGPAPIRGMCR